MFKEQNVYFLSCLKMKQPYWPLFNTRTCALFTRVWCSNLTWHDVDIVFLFLSLFSHKGVPSLGVVSCHREVWVLHGQKR